MALMKLRLMELEIYIFLRYPRIFVSLLLKLDLYIYIP